MGRGGNNSWEEEIRGGRGETKGVSIVMQERRNGKIGNEREGGGSHTECDNASSSLVWQIKPPRGGFFFFAWLGFVPPVYLSGGGSATLGDKQKPAYPSSPYFPPLYSDKKPYE